MNLPIKVPELKEVTAVFIVADAECYGKIRSNSWTAIPADRDIYLNKTIEPSIAAARDIVSARSGQTGYVLTAYVSSSWLNSLPTTLAAGGQIQQAHLAASKVCEFNEQTVGGLRCIAEYARGTARVVEVAL